MARLFNEASIHLVTSALTSHSAQRSWAAWIYPTDALAASFGYLAFKGVERIGVAFGDMRFEREWTNGLITWAFPMPSLNTWHHLVVTYDSGSAANDPAIYVDSVQETENEFSAPTGSPVNNASPYSIGGEAAATNSFPGRLAEWAVWDTLLAPEDINALNWSHTPLRVKPSLLRSYIPMRSRQSPEPDYKISGGAVVTGATPDTHPWMISRPLPAMVGV